MLTIAVGDVHGCYDKLASLLRHCAAYCGDRNPRFVFVGDYIDRGPQSREVVTLLQQVQAASPEEVICLRGNHEEMLLQAWKHQDAALWLVNGGAATLLSYGVRRAQDIPAAHLDWFKSLPLAVSDGKRFFVHAGIEPGVPLEQQAKDVMLWIREPFLSDTRDHGRFIVHGHTPSIHGRAELRPNRLNLDTGACFGGPLTAAVFEDDRIGPAALITDDGAVVQVPRPQRWRAAGA